MDNNYEKICIAEHTFYKIYQGSGIYRAANQQPFHYDPEPTFSYFKKCEGKIKIGGKIYTIEDGCVVIANPREIHCSELALDTYHERISLSINPSLLSRFPMDAHALLNVFYQKENVFSAEDVSAFKLDKLTENLATLAKTGGAYAQTLIVCRLVELLVRLNEVSEKRSISHWANESETVNKVLKYVDAHFCEDISCEKIAHTFYLSKYYLAHLFKEQVGVSLWDYVIFRRLTYFNDLIEQDYSVGEAFERAGFLNYSNFYRLYKKHMGKTPLEYKKQVRAKA